MNYHDRDTMTAEETHSRAEFIQLIGKNYL